MTSNFYPHGKPPTYAYTAYFPEVGNDRSGKAFANTQYPGLNSKQGGEIVAKALSNLQTLINAARAAELSFLNATGINLDDPNASNILRSINDIFNSKETFERGLRYMRNIAAFGKDMKKEQIYRDVSRYFGTYLNQTLQLKLKQFLKADIVRMSPGQIEDLINNIIGEALVRTYEQVADFVNKDTDAIRGKFGNSGKGKAQVRENEEEVQAIKDMVRMIQKLQGLGAFKGYGHLFNLNINTLQQMTDRKDRRYKIKLNKKQFNDAHVDANFGGNILELITSTVAAEFGNINIANSGLTIKGVHTGQMNQMKADTMLFVGRGEINPKNYLDYVDEQGFEGSVRRQNIDALSQYLNDLEKNIEHVIMISDKNYSIKADFGGINAQERMSLKDAGSMLGDFGVGQVEELINYLANCGGGMIQEDVNGEIRTELQTLIGYFLFDHLNITVNGRSAGPNVVNLINVSGIYIPLSAYLEGLLESIKGLMSHPSGLVSVTISLGGPISADSEWTEALWTDFREKHETQSFISYKILKNIAEFISGL